MFQVLLITFLWLVLAPACGAGSEVGNQNATAPPPSVPQDVPSDTVITLVRTNCLGGCATYTVTINADGKVLYEGYQDVKQKGKVESRISQEQLKELIAAFKKINYFDLQGLYDRKERSVPKLFIRRTFRHNFSDSERKKENHTPQHRLQRLTGASATLLARAKDR
jgi:hypothetical protein